LVRVNDPDHDFAGVSHGWEYYYLGALARVSEEPCPWRSEAPAQGTDVSRTQYGEGIRGSRNQYRSSDGELRAGVNLPLAHLVPQVVVGAHPRAAIGRSRRVRYSSSLNLGKAKEQFMNKAIGVCLILECVGCASQPMFEKPGSTGSLQVGQTVAWYVSKNAGIAVLVWSDSPGETGGAAPSGKRYQGSITSHGRRVDIVCETSDGTTGTATINGTTYDLAKGAMFLVSEKHGQTSVVQLQRDLEVVQPTVKNLKNLAKDDKELASFAAAAEEAK
jgi:hypothetical protein